MTKHKGQLSTVHGGMKLQSRKRTEWFCYQQFLVLERRKPIHQQAFGGNQHHLVGMTVLTRTFAPAGRGPRLDGPGPFHSPFHFVKHAVHAGHH
jgi:hypothetical protein